MDAAQQLMLKQGYTATSIDEICAAVGMTKGCFFHHFKNKEDLGNSVLIRFVQRGHQMFANAPFRNETDPLKRVYGYVNFAIEMAQNPMAKQGCLLGNFAQEISGTHETIRHTCVQQFAQWSEALKIDIDEAKNMYAPHVRFDTHSLAEYFIVVLEGALIMAKSRQDSTIVMDSLNHFKDYLKTLFGK